MSDINFKAALTESPKIALNKEHYDAVIATKGNRKLVYEEVLKPNTGDAFFLKAGQVIRMEQRHDVTQIADWFWIRPDLGEWQQIGNSTVFEGTYVRQYSRVWSNIDRMRPMATMIADEAPHDFSPEGWADHFWAFHCSPEWHQIAFPNLPAGHNACHVNFMQGLLRLPAIHAIEDEAERRKVVERLANTPNYQTFQVFRLMTGEDGQIEVDAAPGKPVPNGTGVEFYAEMDVYVILSHCPWVDQSKALDEAEPVPLYISVWDTGIAPLDPPAWEDWQTPFYEAVASGEKDISPRTPDSFGQ